jgi:hypothetical protein
MQLVPLQHGATSDPEYDGASLAVNSNVVAGLSYSS